ncbi:acyl carrier protein [Streptomyces catenulae]|uniref:Acyl carrier protein n=1 Tax=Streptomyces catenulae TaxID=66875 RepID=A0ABV2Z6S9_9ACTN|nr:acyl carrier protein [Streptomyces catenulae]
MTHATYDRLTALLGEFHDAPAEALTPEATFVELGVDSLTMVEIALRIERTLGIEVGDDELTEDLTLAQTVRLIDAKLPADAA